METPAKPPAAVPVAVDLDGTLAATDVLVEGIAALLKRSPLNALRMLPWLLRGKAHLKARVAEEVRLDVAHLPYRPQVIAYLREARARGAPVVLATAADGRVAKEVADQLGLFDEVKASDGEVNLGGEGKRRCLVSAFGEKGFDYVGGAASDLAVWRSARSAVVVGGGAALRRRVAAVAPVREVLAVSAPSARDVARALRLHHWLKNVLVFVPLVAAHRVADVEALGRAALGFVAFGLCASAVYLLNDLTDLDSDRHHPHKRDRPLASGRLPVGAALAAIPVLVGLGLGAALALPREFVGLLVAYLAANLAYSFRLKAVPILDLMMLASLYSLRILAGSAATGIGLSAWLLAFSMFLFLSLALAKRYAELMTMRTVEGAHARARGYRLEDAELLASLGGGAGYLAVLVLALYIDSDASRALYDRPRVLWADCVLLLYWVSHLWLMAHRRQMDDDPLLFAIRDPVSRVLLVLMAAATAIAV